MKTNTILVAIIFCCLFISVKSKAQLIQAELDEKVGKSSLIIEGKVIDRKSFWNDAHTMIYTANTVEVYKLFKGDVKEKTVEVITWGGSVDLFYIEASDMLTIDNGQTGIFFCQPNAKNIKSPFSKRILMDVYSGEQGFIQYDEQDDIAYAPFVQYKGIEKNLYSLIEQKTGKSYSILNNNYKINTNSSENIVTGTLASITSFSPATVHGGTLNDPTNNTLTINGSGFGATPSGQSGVRFLNASPNLSSYYKVKYNSYLMVSWSDTKIVVKVPANAGTGNIAVITSAGTAIASSTPLNVLYSVLNANFKNFGGYDTLFTEPRLMNTNGSGGYTFHYSTSTAGNGKNFSTAPEKATFQRALTTWKEQVGLNFIEGTTTTVQQAAADAFNVIMFDNTNTGNLPLPAFTLATTISYFSVCATGSTIYTSQKIGFDLIVRNNGVSSGNTSFLTGPCFPSSEYDLEMVILHELGHALNLAHIIDDLESSNGNNALYVNPSKLMHYAVSNYVNRRSLDVSAYEGALYTTTQQHNNYGVCSGAFTSEMTPLSYTVIPNDNCPASFPTTVTPSGTVVNFDLVHATSNKFVDPQFTDINCKQDNGQFVTNNAFYAIKTNSIAGSTLNISISGYTTTPVEQASCAGQGVRLAVYDVSTCPDGQNYPPAIACRTFTGNGELAAITGLSANHNYLLYFDGMRNTKANFNATLNGTALPLTLSKFYGEYINNTNQLYIEVLQAINVKTVKVEKSADGTHFTAIGTLPYSGAALAGRHTYIDALPFAGNNYYRLATTNNDGSVEYSNIILLKNESKRIVYIYPNPVKDALNINITATIAAKYHYSIYDMSGKLILTNTFYAQQGTQTTTIKPGNIAAGSYIIKITDATGTIIARQQILKQ